jgi:hypothetical protein
VLPPDIALRDLLASTDFSMASFEQGTVTILAPPRPAKEQDLAAVKMRAATFTPYFALIQAGLRSAFCRVPEVRADDAELIVRLWIAPSGAIARSDILSPPASDGRDQAYAAALRDLVIGEPPPPLMPQPVTMMVLPRTSASAAQCPESRATP